MSKRSRPATSWLPRLCAASIPFLVVLAACDGDPQQPDRVTAASIQIAPERMSLREMDVAQLTVTVRDASGRTIDRPVSFASSAPDRLAVDPTGTVTALWGGTTEMIQVAVDGLAAKAIITLEEYPATITFDEPTVRIVPAQTQLLPATVRCRNGHAMERELQWSTSNSSVVVVNGDGRMTGMAPGIAVIRATVGDAMGELTVTVGEGASYVEVEPQRQRLRAQQTLQLRARVLTTGGLTLDDPVTWQSLDPAIASVSSAGLVAAHKTGDATIVASSGSRKGYALITVDPAVARIRVVPESAFLTVGSSIGLGAAALTAAGVSVDVPIVWQSSDEAIATVDAAGSVLGLAPGVVRIEATGEGQVGSALLTIERPAASITLTPPAATITVGNPLTLEATVTDVNGNLLHMPVLWSTSAPEIASVNTGGVVMAWSVGTAMITASAGAHTASATIQVSTYAAKIELDVSVDTLYRGQSAKLVARVLDPRGTVLPLPVAWSTSDSGVVTVDASGVVTGEHFGTAVVTAAYGSLTVSATFVVLHGQPGGRVRTVVVSPNSGHVDVGGTVQLSATALDDLGAPVATSITWTTDAPTVASVDGSGKVTGLTEGTAIITADAEGVKASAIITVKKPGSPGGGHEEGLGNNLSNPVVFAEGIGITGLPVGQDPGLRPTVEENIPVSGTAAFWYSGNTPDYQGIYFTQKSQNVWRAEWLDGSGGLQDVSLDWGDNIESHTWNSHSMIRIETVLYSATVAPLTGFNMVYLSGQGPTELQGADGTTALFTPTVFAVTPRLTIQRLDDTTREPIPGAIAFDGTVGAKLGEDGPGGYGAEVNVGGKVIYGYNFIIRDLTLPLPEGVHKYGWWRITFSLEPSVTVNGVPVGRNVRITGLQTGDHATYTPVLDASGLSSWIDIWVAQGGGGGGGNH